MQKSEKSFLFSLGISFLLAFSVAAYLSSPYSLRVTPLQAQADELEDATSTPAIPFSNLQIITLIQEGADVALATSTEATTTPAATSENRTMTEGNAPKTASVKKVSKQTAPPVRLIIPSIGLSAPIDSVGLNDKGEMDVPAGNSSEVGWYKYGTIPGNVGSAVIDAHVFAAFEDLRYLKVGAAVIVENANGERLEFTVNDSRVYKLGELTSGMLFGKRDARRLNLITCAGEPTADGSTYTHRLVVYTTLTA
jgi:sortase (surface protein transpeptidase)